MPELNFIDRYYSTLTSQLKSIHRDQKDSLETAASWVADAVTGENWLYVFGTGHSHMLAEEVFYRAGGLVRAVPILDDSLMLHRSASQSTQFERQESYATELIQRYPITKNDVLIIASNSGRNPVPVELARQAGIIGTRIIGIVNHAHCQAFPSRHSSGRNLTESVDLVIDNAGVPGDAALSAEGLPGPICATSTITGTFIIQSIVAGAVQKCTEAGTIPEIYLSSNGADPGHNERILERFQGSIPHL